MKEDEKDRLIREAARESYNVAPELPRDEMWARIQQARRVAADGRATTGAGRPNADGRLALESQRPETGGAAPSGDAPLADVVPFRRRVQRWAWRALPIAALLILSFGLGRLSLRYQRPSGLATTLRPPTSPAPTSSPASPAPRSGASTRAAGIDAGPAPGAARLARQGETRSAGEGAGHGAETPSTATEIYRFAAVQTLGQAEMLLTSFRAETRARGAVDPQVAEWAGDVLSSTRLLLDSPAGRDPKLRGLLEDLELVLAQIVQLRAAPAASRPGDAQLIEHALQQRDLLPRLRTAVPAGASAGT